MNYDPNYVDFTYKGEDLNEEFRKQFIRFRKENNLTQEVFAKFANVSRVKIARIENGTHSPSVLSLLNILGPIGYTIKIVKVKERNKNDK